MRIEKLFLPFHWKLPKNIFLKLKVSFLGADDPLKEKPITFTLMLMKLPRLIFNN